MRKMDQRSVDRTDDAAVKMIDSTSVQIVKNHSDRLTFDNRNPPVHVEFNDLHYSISQGKGKRVTILHSISGGFRPGKLTVLIGPSGAGKTTLLKIICGLEKRNVRGAITVNGNEINRDEFRKSTCYVPQEFVLMPLLSTRETLYIAARLKLAGTPRNPHSVVNEIAEGLGLMNCLDTLVENLSGGERKRLSIGMEIVTKPSLMLLDEPTSGLDSAASNQVISLLRTMARAGCTVTCVVHQPSSQMMSQFDDVIVLSQGRCMYSGPREYLIDTFGIAGYACPQFYNIAEFVLEVVTETRRGDLMRLCNISYDNYLKWKSQGEYMENGKASGTEPFDYTEISKDYDDETPKLSICEEHRILFLRAMICIKRDKTMTVLRLVAHLVIGILLGLVYYDFGNDAGKVISNTSCIFFFLMFLFFANSMPAVQMFPTEAAVLLREHVNNWYHLGSYYSVKIISDLPLQFLCPTLFLSSAYYLSGQPMETHRILQSWLICILLTILGQTVGVATGTVFNMQIGTFLIPALSVPLLLFAGFFMKLEEISLYFLPLRNISFFRYAFEGFIRAIYEGDRKLPCSEFYCVFQSPEKILRFLNMPSVSMYTIITALLAWILFLHILTYTILYWKLRRAVR